MSDNIDELLSQLELADNKDVVRQLENTLSKLKLSSQAVASRIITLLDAGLYSAALAFISNLPASTKGGFSLEQAYALYRLNREQEAIEILEMLHSNSRAHKHLLAQCFYKAEELDKAQSIYEEIGFTGSDMIDMEAEDMATNLLAITAQKALLTGVKVDVAGVSISDLASHEQLYNLSLIQSQSSVYQSIQTLEKAEKVLAGIGLEGKEFDEEIAPILLLRAHLLQASELNSRVEAMQLKGDNGYVAKVNKIGLRASDELERNPYLIHKAYFAGGPGQSTRLSKFQERHVAYAKILALQGIGMDIKSSVKAYEKAFGAAESQRFTAVNILVYRRMSEHSLAQKVKNGDQFAMLETVSRLIVRKKLSAACALLETASEESIMPLGVMLTSILVGLYDATGQWSRSEKLIQNFVEKVKDSKVEVEVLEGLIKRCIKLGKISNLEDLAAQLYRKDPTSVTANAALSLFTTHSTQSTQVRLELPDLSSVDVVKLELAPTKYSDSSTTTSTDKMPQFPSKKRKRLPKNVDLTEPEESWRKREDPERWLPRRDRSYYKPNAKERAKMAKRAGLTQGGVGNAESTTQTTGKVTGGEVKRKKKKGKK